MRKKTNENNSIIFGYIEHKDRISKLIGVTIRRTIDKMNQVFSSFAIPVHTTTDGFYYAENVKPGKYKLQSVYFNHMGYRRNVNLCTMGDDKHIFNVPKSSVVFFGSIKISESGLFALGKVSILKNPTAANIHATNFKSSPITGIAAPISRIKPAVLNMFSFDFSERISNDFL